MTIRTHRTVFPNETETTTMELGQDADTTTSGSSHHKATRIISVLCATALVAMMLVSKPSDFNEMNTLISRITGGNPVAATLYPGGSIISSDGSGNSSSRRALSSSSGATVQVFYDATATSQTSMVRKFQHELAGAGTMIEAVPLDVQKPSPASVSNVPGAAERIEELVKAQQPHLALEVLKYCSFLNGGSGLFLDASSSILMDTLEHVLQGIHGGKSNLAVVNDGFLPSSIHGALLYMHPNHATTNRKLAQQMLEILITTNMETLLSNPTLLPKSLYDLIAVDSGLGSLTAGAGDRWYILQHSCTIEPLGGRPATAPISTYALQSYR